MHERFDQRCEIPKSLRGRVRAFDVRWQGMARPGVWSGGRAAEAEKGGGAEGRRTRERAGGVAGNAYLSRAETHPRALSLARSLAYLLALVSPGAHERPLACRSSVPYAKLAPRDERARDCITSHSLPHLLAFKRQNYGLRWNSSNRKIRGLPAPPLNFSPRCRETAVWHVFPAWCIG